MIKKILPYIIGLSLIAAPALATSIKYSQLTSGGTIATTDVFPVLRTTAVSGAVTAGGLIKLTVDSTTGIATSDQLSVSGVTGTTEANGQWIVTVNDATHLTLQGSVFAHAYVSGGQVNFNPGVAVGALAATTPGTGVATALGINIGSAGAPVTFNGALGTPSSGTATNLTGTASALNIGGNAATSTLAANATNTGITEDTTTNATMYPTWVTANTGNLPQKTTSTKLTFNPSTGMLSSTGFTGALTGNASTVTNGIYTTDTGTVTNTMLAGSIALTKLATQATNTVVGNATSGSAAPTALAVGTCSTAGSALNWTTNTGFGCNTSITAAAVPASGLTGTTLASGVTASSLTSFGAGIALGTPASGVATNLTGTATALNIGGNAATATLASTVTTNANLTGDVTSSGNATTLATVNSNVGSFGSSTSIPSITVNGKGLVTAASGNAVVAPAGTLTGTTLASGVTASSLTSTGTLTGGATGAGFTVAIGTSTLTGTLPAANNETNLRHTSIGATFNGGGSAIAANSKQWVYVPYGTTIQSVTIACDVSGSIVFDVQMDTYANFSTSMTSIVASAPPTVASALKSQDLTLTGWTVAIPAGDYILFKVTSATTVTNCNIVLDTIRT